MKKIFCILCALIVLVSCGGGDKPESPSGTGRNDPVINTAETSISATETETSADTTEPSVTETTATETTETETETAPITVPPEDDPVEGTVKPSVFMYHLIMEEPYSIYDGLFVRPSDFAAQLDSVVKSGAVSLFADEYRLTAKPSVVITFDDGYTSNLIYGAPILEKYGQKAVIYVIGINAGRETYIHTGEPLSPPRFGLKEAAPYIKSGVLEIQSHTFDMHQRIGYGVGERDGMLLRSGESRAEYRAAVLKDAQQQRELFEHELGSQITSLAYPFGLYCDQSEELMKELGIRVTLTTHPGENLVCQYVPDSLRQMRRHTITDRETGEDLLALLAEK